MNTKRTSLPLNKGLLDARSVGRTLADLRKKFYPVEFFDLCSIIEEIVLRDEIVLVGKFGMLPREHRAALRPFIDAGVFGLCIDLTQILKTTATDARLRSAALQANVMGWTNASVEDSDFAVTRLLGAEVDLNVPTIPLLQHLHNYQFFRRPILDDTVCDLVSRYGDLKTRAEQAKAMDSRRLALKPIGIPPIALQVIQRAGTFDQIWKVTLETRDDFRVLRDAMRSLAETLADPDLPSEQFFKLVDQWEHRWRKLVEGMPTCSLQVGKSAAALLSSGAEIAKAYQKGAVMGALVAGTRLITSLSDLRGTMVFRPVHLSVNNYLRTHPQRMVIAVSRVFAEDPNSVRRKMEAVGSSTTSVWRQALASFTR